MLKPVRWNTFAKDLLVIQFGFLLYGLGLALLIRANLGTSTWLVLEIALADLLGISIGAMTVWMGFVVLVVALLFREKVGWGTLGNILSIGPWLNLFLGWMPQQQHGNWILRVFMFLLAVVVIGVASAVYIGVDAGAGPRDSLMLAVHRVSGVSVRVARSAIEVVVVGLGWLLGGPAGWGTLAFALLIGPAVQWAFKVFKVHPHRLEITPAVAVED
jgi:uncharacterized membrane protein YczE